jgi:hypothetical protein
MANMATAATAAPAMPFLAPALVVARTGLTGLVLLAHEPVPDGFVPLPLGYGATGAAGVDFTGLTGAAGTLLHDGYSGFGDGTTGAAGVEVAQVVGADFGRVTVLVEVIFLVTVVSSGQLWPLTVMVVVLTISVSVTIVQVLVSHFRMLVFIIVRNKALW